MENFSLPRGLQLKFMIKVFYTSLFILLLQFTIYAQDQHFTQFFAAPLTLNPALSGAFDGNYRLGIVHRDQGGQEVENPYLTTAAAIDLRFNAGKVGKTARDAFGIGVLFYNDRVPDFDLSTNQMFFSGAYHKSLGKANEQFLSVGFQVGIAQRNINYNNLSFGDQFDGSTGYTIGTGESLPENNFAYFDMGIGLNYTLFTEKNTAIYLGAAYHHFNEPQVSFYYDKRAEVQLGDDTLLPKFTSYLSLQLPVGETVQLHPRLLFYSQGRHLAVNAGSNLRFLFSDVKGTALHVGGWVRPVRYEDDSYDLDSAILMTGFELNNFLLGFSYDLNLSDASNIQSRRGALEFSIVYLGNYENELILCPKF